MRLIDADALIEEVQDWVDPFVLTFINNAPTVEPCYNISSCSDCKNYDKENHNCPRYCEVIKEALTAIKSRPKGEWIPVSERTPDDRVDTYWVCTNDGYQCQCRWTNVNPFWTNLETDWHWCHFDIPQYQEVIAWQPLPEPYQKGGAV